MTVITQIRVFFIITHTFVLDRQFLDYHITHPQVKLGDYLMRQSIPAALSQPQALAFFFAFDGKFPGVGTLMLSNPPGVGTQKEGKCPVLRQHCNIFHYRHYVRFFVSINVFLCNSARILIKTSSRDDIHQFTVLVLI